MRGFITKFLGSFTLCIIALYNMCKFYNNDNILFFLYCVVFIIMLSVFTLEFNDIINKIREIIRVKFYKK